MSNIECAVDEMESELKKAEAELNKLSSKVDQIEWALSTWSVPVHQLTAGVREAKMDYKKIEEEYSNMNLVSSKDLLVQVEQLHHTAMALTSENL